MTNQPTRNRAHSAAVAIVHDRFERWIIALPPNLELAWSGSRWVTIDPNGFPAGDVQVTNFDTVQEALDAAHAAGFTVLILDPHPLRELQPA
jgi:hypothetical protein